MVGIENCIKLAHSVLDNISHLSYLIILYQVFKDLVSLSGKLKLHFPTQVISFCFDAGVEIYEKFSDEFLEMSCPSLQHSVPKFSAYLHIIDAIDLT